MAIWKQVLGYGVLLAAGTLALQWLEYQHLVRMHSGEFYVFLVAVAFLVLGVVIGVRVFSRREPPPSFDGNPKVPKNRRAAPEILDPPWGAGRAQPDPGGVPASLGISPRELTVLHELAAGRSNKEIAAQLNISPNTVKTHVSRLFEKLGAARRTDAINKARELGLVP